MRKAHRLFSAVSFTSLAALAALIGCKDESTSETHTSSANVEPSPSPLPQTAPTPEPSALPKTNPSDDWRTHLAPDMKAVLDELKTLGGKPIETLTADEARKQPTPADAVKALLKKEGKKTDPEEVGKISNTSFPGPGGTVPIRVYTPKDGKGPFPVILYFHGGGFVIATNDTYDATPRALANGAGAVVVSVEYRKAPENKFPAAPEDAYSAYEWLLKHVSSVNGDPKKIAVAGESAGGNLAANVAIMARDKKERLPDELLLVYPVVSSNMDSQSYVQNANAEPLDRAMMGWFTTNYFRTPADSHDARVDILDANLAGLPPTTIVNAEVDPLRSDGEQLAAKMKAAGDKVEQKTFMGVTHEFFGMGAAVAEAKNAMSYAADHLKAGFAK
jgi:acetyl esterase